MSEPTYLTAEGKTKLEAELIELKGPRREELAKRLRSAIQMGDLSENADYHQAKEDQGFLEGRIQEIEYLLRNVVIIEKSASKDMISIGSHVTIQEGKFPSETYHVVGAKEADPRTGRYRTNPQLAAVDGSQSRRGSRSRNAGRKNQTQDFKNRIASHCRIKKSAISMADFFF